MVIWRHGILSPTYKERISTARRCKGSIALQNGILQVTAKQTVGHRANQSEDSLDVARSLTAPRDSGVFPDARAEGFRIPKQRTDDDRARREEIISHLPVFAQQDIPDEDANWVHAVQDEHSETVEDSIRKWENADREWDAVADELVDLLKLLDDKVQALVVKQAEWDRLAQHASYDFQGNTMLFLVDDATEKEMVKLEREIAGKNGLIKSRQGKLGAA